MENKISKYDLRIGNMFEQGIVWKISGRAGAKVHLHGKGKWYKGFRSEFDVKDLKPILITEEVLSWVKEKVPADFGNFKGVSSRVIISSDYEYNGRYSDERFEIKYLHEWQNLHYAVYKRELEIKG